MAVNVLDDRGEKWMIGAGDPASKVIATLTKQGFGRIILPREVLTTGLVRGIMERPLTDLDDSEFVHTVRLNACLAALKGGADEAPND